MVGCNDENSSLDHDSQAADTQFESAISAEEKIWAERQLK
jgi:hypothetical protein